MLDTELRHHITDALEFEPSLDAAHIGVAVEEGIVTLTGHVPTYAQKTMAERVAAHVKGVRGLAQEIEVRPEGSHQSADDEIAKRAVNMLRWNTSVPADAVTVRVANGYVTLEGMVEWNFQREAAEKALRGLWGVTGLRNRLMLKPTQPSPNDVRQLIEKALRRDAELDAAQIHIKVADGRVTLDGKVDCLADRRLAEQAAWAAPGVHAVEDHLTVG